MIGDASKCKISFSALKIAKNTPFDLICVLTLKMAKLPFRPQHDVTPPSDDTFNWSELLQLVFSNVFLGLGYHFTSKKAQGFKGLEFCVLAFKVAKNTIFDVTPPPDGIFFFFRIFPISP